MVPATISFEASEIFTIGIAAVSVVSSTPGIVPIIEGNMMRIFKGPMIL